MNNQIDTLVLNTEENQSRFKVSVSARLVQALAYSFPILGGALSSVMLMNVMRALRNSETAGIAAVMGGMAEAAVPVLVCLYLAVFCGFAFIILLLVRMVIQTKTASPPGWLFAIGGIFCFLPVDLFWRAESTIIELLITPNSAGIGGAASAINWFLLLSVIAAPVVFILLIIESVWSLSSRSKPKWSPLITAISIEILLIAVTIAFQMRLIWLHQSAISERIL